MNLFIPIDRNPCQLTGNVGDTFGVSSVTVKRRDASLLQLVYWRGLDVEAVRYEFPEEPEIIFTGKTVGDYAEKSPPVRHTVFEWNEETESYDGKPSYNTVQLTAKFVSANGVDRVTGTTHTLAIGNKLRLVAMENAGASTITVPEALGADGDVFYVHAAGIAGATLSPGSGAVTLNVTGGAELAMALGEVLRLTRVAANVWTVEPAPQVEKVTLMGEITWRLPSSPDDWTSTVTFNIEIQNDVNQGVESAPQNTEDPTNYYSKGETDALLADKANAADVYTKTETDDLLDDKANAADVYTKIETDGLLAAKANDNVVIKKTGTTLTAPEKTQVLGDIGAEPLLVDLVTAQSVAAPVRRLAWNAKGRITGFSPRVSSVVNTSSQVSASTADLVLCELAIPANTLKEGQWIEAVAYGVTNNGTTASTLRAYIATQQGGSTVKYGPVSFAMGTSAASAVPWCVRARWLTKGVGVTHMRLCLEFLWKTSSGVLESVSVEVDPTLDWSFLLINNVTVATGTLVKVEAAMMELHG